MDTQTVDLSLLDAPQPWLLKLISGQYLDSASKLSLFQTCRQLNEMVMKHSQSTSLSLVPLSRPMDAQVNKLHVASRHAPSIKLVLIHTLKAWKYHPYYWNQQEDKRSRMGVSICSFLQAGHKLGVTSCVTSLQLTNATLDVFLPAAIGEACPNLRSLALHYCRIKEEAAGNASNAIDQLQSLVVQGGKLSSQHLQAHMAAMTALQSLTVVRDPAITSGIAGIINPVAGKLTHLHWDPIIRAKLASAVDWVKLGATLQHLQLGEREVSDEDMKMFLEMPCLSHVEAGFRLHTSFAGQPCNWQELTTFDINLQTLAFLPLHSGLLLKVLNKGQLAEVIVDLTSLSWELHMAQQAVTNLQKAQGVQWDNQGVKLIVRLKELDSVEFCEVLVQALPLVSHARKLAVECQEHYYDEYSSDHEFDEHYQHLTGKAIQVLSEWIGKGKDAYCLHLKDCSIEAEHAVRLVKAMPCGSTLELRLNRICTEQVITQMCCAAQNKLSLHIWCRDPLPAGYMDRIKSAMQPHQHVEVIVSFLNVEEEEEEDD